MKKGTLIMADGESCADLIYASGFYAPDPFVFFAVSGQKYIIVSTLEYNRAVKEVKAGVKVLNRQDIFAKNTKIAEQTNPNLLRQLTAQYRVDCWEVPDYFPVVYADFLRGLGCQLSVKAGGFFPERTTKNRQEVGHIAQGLSLAEKGMTRAVAILTEAEIGPGGKLRWRQETLSTEIMRAEIEMVIGRNGACARRTIIAGGRQGADPHHPGAGPLFARQSIIIDIFPRLYSHGYWGDLTRTFVKGRAPAGIRAVFAAVKAARDRAKKSIRAGVKAAAVHTLAEKTMQRYGFRSGKRRGQYYGFIHGLGHGVGLDIHEAPRLAASSVQTLAAGQVVTVEPGLYYPAWGGVRLEDLVVVEAQGCRCLTTFPTFLEIP